MNDSSQVSSVSINSNYIQVKESQKRNPVLQYIRNVQWEFNSGIVPDYVLGGSTCALFITLKFHLLHSRYLDGRMREVGKCYRLRVVICQVDTDDNIKALLDLNKLCFSSSFTLILAWSALEAGRYIETLKSYEHKPASSIQGRVDEDFLPKLTSVLKTIRSVNRTDVITLLEAFKNFKGLCEADEQQLVLCPGIGEKKVKRLYQALHTPFKRKRVEDTSADSNVHITPYLTHSVAGGAVDDV